MAVPFSALSHKRDFPEFSAWGTILSVAVASLSPVPPPLPMAQGSWWGQGEGGLLHWKLKFLGLLQNLETWPKEDGVKPSLADVI